METTIVASEGLMEARGNEPMCETSEENEKLIHPSEVLPISLEIGRRILEVFGYQQISNIVFRLRSTHDEIDSVLNGKSLPTTEVLLGIQKVTGASIDWLLTGKGPKYLKVRAAVDHPNVPATPDIGFAWDEKERGHLL